MAAPNNMPRINDHAVAHIEAASELEEKFGEGNSWLHLALATNIIGQSRVQNYDYQKVHDSPLNSTNAPEKNE